MCSGLRIKIKKRFIIIYYYYRFEMGFSYKNGIILNRKCEEKSMKSPLLLKFI